MNPTDYTRMNNMGLVYERLGEHRKAAMAFSQAKNYDSPIRGKTMFSEAKNWFLAQDYNQAIIAWDEVNRAFPNTPEVIFYMAQTYEAMGKAAEAISHYRHLLALTSTPQAQRDYADLIQLAKSKLGQSN